MVHLSTLATLAAAVVGVHSYYGPPCPGDKCAQSATPYCSSYLGVPKKTVTSTYTSTAIVTKYTTTKNVYGKPTTITTTITVPKTEQTTVTVTSSTDTQSTVTVTPTCMAPVTSLLDKRQKRQNYGYGQPYGHPAKPTKPACFSPYKQSADVSQACKCLSIKPSVTTAKTTITQTSTVTTCKEITKAPTATSTTTVTMGETTKTATTTTSLTTTLDPTTVSAPFAFPTNFNLVYLDNGVSYYANVDATAVQKRVVAIDDSQPILFELPTSETATVFSLDDNNSLTIPDDSGTFNNIAEIPGGTDALQKLTYGSDGNVPVACTIFANTDDTCGLQCSAPPSLGYEYSCGHTGIFELGDGTVTTDADGESCTVITPFVVDVGTSLVTVPII
ncbi:hypothetical protein DOTSEDRAFT_35693 [Dothistroma septosporum NZE10]|uniref:Peptidase A1 domain-containing protein n=1 Tax=Dothistroma septosporum (strain NZE10 / CBS 128990) TaxID=675120 RepID=M2WN41_DOTSN|nr:hypothetical protein DOTSEDRAFT_35693 [Dothistroma septosporum NZE10]